MADVAIETRQIVKAFGKRLAVDHVDMRVSVGEIYGLVGPSGAGKTTLIRMMCGLTSPTSGSARLLAHSIPGEREAVDDRIGYMPQEHAVYRDLSVAENLLFFGQIYGMDRRMIAARTDELLALMQMPDLGKQRADLLSGGEKQRLSLACALIHSPELLLLDEPTIGLDPALRSEFWEHFRTLKQNGRTILLTTHYLEEAGRCDRVGMMRLGRLVAEGTPDELRQRVSADGMSVSMEQVFLELTQASKSRRSDA